MGIILTVFAIASYYIIQKTIEHSIERKFEIARLIRNNIEEKLKTNLNRLYDISLSGSIDLTDNDFNPEREALSIAYRYSLFTDGVFLLDRNGNLILDYPERVRDFGTNLLGIEPIGRIIGTGRPVISNIYTVEPLNKKVIFALAPLKDRNGNIVGAVGGEIDPTNPALSYELGLTEVGKNVFIDIMDANGVVIASSDPLRVLTCCDHDKFFSKIINAKKELVTTCHECHESGSRKTITTNMLVFVPLESASWGISIQEPVEDVFSPAKKLKKTFITMGIVFILTAFILTIGINRSIVNPVRELIKATGRIARGELEKPIVPHGSDEIGILAKSFEIMRVRLLESMESIKKYSLELEDRVRERTRQIEESQKRVESLLKKIISSQEEERKRIARELHDETLQSLSAILMRIDMYKLYPEKFGKEKTEELRDIVLRAWEGVLSVIQNLRPSIIDDLGLEAAIKWLFDTHLGEKGINYFFNIKGLKEKRFPPEIEIALFRIIQEAVVNISKHSDAENVILDIDVNENMLRMEIKDDGKGFDIESLFDREGRHLRDGRGLGIMGMKERASLIGGELEIKSAPGEGCTITLIIPVKPRDG